MSSGIGKIFKEYFEALIIALVLALFIRAFVVQAFKIPSGSMLPTLQIGDHLLVNKFIYGIKIPFTDKYIVQLKDPKRGDIIVFEYPRDPSKDYIKRVIGTPGDTLEIRDKKVYINGEAIDEPYAQYTGGPPQDTPRDNLGPLTVPENSYFVMGDNRDGSHDSRFWGFVERSEIKGRAFMIYWSFGGGVRWNRIGDMVR